MAMTDGIMPVMDVSPSNSTDGGFMGGGMWIFFLFILLLFKGDGFGGGAGNGQISNDFMYSNLNNGLGRIQDQNTFNANTLQQGLCSTSYENLNNFKDLQAQLSNCCCTTQKEILVNRYEAAQNTCAITNAIHADGEATRALINANTMQELRDRLAAAELGISQAAQTANIVQQVRPFPIPAYATCSPYASPGTCTIC